MNKVFGGAYETASETVLISDGRVVVPDAEALFQGDYARQGPDLVIEGLDGAIFRIVGYFTAEAAPDLCSEQGAVITGDVATRLAGPQTPMTFAQAGPPAGLSPIGQVETLDGLAFATRAGGQRVALHIGDPVFEDDLIETGGASALGITFIDETVFSLSANARMILDELVYDPNGSDNSMIMNLVQGTFVFVTGQVAPTGDMRVETPVATMGIRGTTPMVVIEGQNGATEFSILRDPDGKIGSYTLYDKVSGASIERVVSESTILQLTQAGGTPVPITVDATRLAERAEAQDNAYFVYTASRARIDRERQNNDNNQQDDNPDDRSDADDGSITTGSIPGQGGTGSGGLKGFNVSLGNQGGEGETQGDGTTGTGTTQTGSGRGGTGSDAAGNLAPTTSNATFQFHEDAGIVQGPFSASDDGGLGNLTFEITQQPAFGFVSSNRDGTFTYIADPIFNTLQQGEVTAVTFTYRATDSVGAVSNVSQVTLQVVGTNDVPTITVVDVNGTISDVDEDASTPPSANAGDLTTTGSITFYDVDFLDRPFATEATKSITATAQGGGLMTLTAAQRAAIESAFSIENVAGNTSTGTINWTYTIAESSIDFLGAGEVVTAVFTITLNDGFGGVVTQDVTVTINGAGAPNDAPVITAVDVTGAVADVAEDSDAPPAANAGVLNESGSVTFADVDLTDRPVATEATTSVTGTAQGGGNLPLTQAQITAIEAAFSIANAQNNTNDGLVTWDFTINESAVDFLGEGETVTAVFTITVTDDEGATDSQDVTIVINGANDAPVIGQGDFSAFFTEAPNQTGSTALLSETGTLAFSDVDLTDTHTISVGQPTADWSGGQGVPAATLAAIQTALTIAGGDVATGDGAGTIDWAFDLEDQFVDFLGEGEILTLTYTIAVADDEDATDSKDVTVTITGTNDAPVIASSDTAIVYEDQSLTLTDTGSIDFADPDLSDGHAVQVQRASTVWSGGTTLPAGLAVLLDTALAAEITDQSQQDGTGQLAWNFSLSNTEVDFIAAGETLQTVYDITVTDSAAGALSDTVQVTITIVGTNDDPVLDAIAQTNLTETTDASAITGNINVTFTDFDLTDVGHLAQIAGVTTGGHDTGLSNLTPSQLESFLSLSAVSKTAGSDQGTMSATFTADSTVFDYLDEGQPAQVIYTLQVSDGDGGVDYESIVIEVTGTNDTPTISLPSSPVVQEDSSDNAIAGISVADPDTSESDALTVQLDASSTVTLSSTTGLTFLNGDGTSDASMTFYGAPSAINAALATLSYTPTPDENGSGSITITVDDGVATPVTSSLTVNITPVNDAPVIAVPGAQSTDENTALTISGVTVSDVDAGSDPIAVTLAVGNGSLVLTLASGLTFTDSDGSDGTLAFSGSQADITAALAQSIKYTPDTDFFGTDTLTVTASDQGSSGAGAPGTDTETIAITVGNFTIQGTAGNDTLTGDENNDRITALAGNDQIFGGDGNDTIHGGNGADTLHGGQGDDVLLPGDNQDFDTIVGSGGSDTIDFSGAGALGFYALDYSGLAGPINVNIGPADGTVGKGNAGTDALADVDTIAVGGGLQIIGTDGDDTFTADLGDAADFIQFRGGAGSDTIIGGNGQVRADYLGDPNGVNVNLALGTATDGFGGNDSLTGIDEVRGSESNDTLVGSDANERFITQRGDDFVDGGGGTDTIRYDRAGVASVVVDLSNSTNTVSGTWDGFAFTDTLLNIENVRGSAGDDVITGDGNANILAGRGGNDTLAGGAGNDTLLGGGGNDRLVVDTADGMVDGGAGFDVLDRTAGGNLDLRGAAAPFANVEAIDLVNGTAETFAINSIELLAITAAGNRFAVLGSNLDTVTSNDDWIATGTTTLSNGATGTIFGFNGAELVVQDGVNLNFNCDQDPIVLDLDGDGFAFTPASAGVTFDLDNDGLADGLGWVSASDGLLVSDLDGSGKIENGSEVFSPWYGDGGFADALAALATLDVNGDGVVDANDEGFDTIQVWLDSDTDAETDDGELKGLAEHGIESIDLAATRVDAEIDGQSVFAEGTFTLADGSTRGYAGVAFETADPLAEALVALAEAGPAPQQAPAGQLDGVSGATIDHLADALAGGGSGSGYNLDGLFGSDDTVPTTDGATAPATAAQDSIFGGDDAPADSAGGSGAGTGFAAADMMMDDMATAV